MTQDLELKVRYELMRREMQYRDLAKLIGISGAYLSDILTGRRNGPAAQRHAENIRKVLGIKEGEK